MRYFILILLNLPVIILAVANIVTQYKLNKISARKFRWTLVIWLVVFAIITASFPVYNLLSGRELFAASALSFFDIAEIVTIAWLFYIANRQRQKLRENEKMLRDLHKVLAIKLAEK